MEIIMIYKKFSKERSQEIDQTLKSVYEALDEKGYNAIDQIWEYLLTEDETYITSYKNARKLITAFDREEIGFYLLEKYFKVLIQ